MTPSRVEWLTVDGFRSYQSVRWDPDPGVNVIVGDNGAGKTNLLEAIGYLATLKSFRGSPDHALIGHSADRAVIRASLARSDGDTLLEMEIPRSGRRRARLNTQPLRRSSDLLGVVRVVAFIPDDLDLVKRGPAHRRDLLDDLAVQLWPGAWADQQEFDRALRQRNAFLRQRDHDEITLSVWDERVSQAGGKVMARRARAAAAVGEYLSESYATIAGEDATVSIEYRSTWGGNLDPRVPLAEHRDRLKDALAQARRVDLERHMTTVGPHRDDPAVILEGHDSRYHASQGQQRSLVLALRLAGHAALVEYADVRPLLLLDDVFSELDQGRAERLAKALPAGQTFITATSAATVPVPGHIWHVEGGEIT